MIIEMTQRQAERILGYLAGSEDAETMPGGGYTCDLYELEPPVTLELYPAKGGLDVAAAFVLNYDEGQDGYYLGEKLETADAVRAALSGWSLMGEGE